MNVNGYDIKPGANLWGAYLRGANLRGADLRGANLWEANIRDADLRGAALPPFKLPGGELDVWGKKNGVLVQMRIPRTAGRVITPVGRKCRFSFAHVVEVHNDSGEVSVVNDYGTTIYRTGGTVAPHEWCPDWRIECAPGIHAWLTREEAEAW